MIAISTTPEPGEMSSEMKNITLFVLNACRACDRCLTYRRAIPDVDSARCHGASSDTACMSVCRTECALYQADSMSSLVPELRIHAQLRR